MKELPNGAMKSTPTPTRRRRRRRRSMRRRRPTSGTLIRRPIHLVSFLIAIHLDIFIFILVWVWFVFYNLKKKQLLNLEMSCTGFLPSWLCWLTKASDWLFSFWPFFLLGREIRFRIVNANQVDDPLDVATPVETARQSSVATPTLTPRDSLGTRLAHSFVPISRHSYSDLPA